MTRLNKGVSSFTTITPSLRSGAVRRGFVQQPSRIASFEEHLLF